MAHAMQIRSAFLVAFGALALGSCDDVMVDGDYGTIADTPDPLIARALNDPIMVDPDLAYRNQANAALTIRYDHALPPHMSTTESAEAALEAARRELLVGGSINELPVASQTVQGEPLALGMTAQDIMAVTGAPARCANAVTEGLVWASRMPDPARIMPHGMTMQAAGAETSSCNIRIVRYVTPVPKEDVLRYHFTRAARAGMTINRFSKPEDILIANRGSQHFKVYARPGQGGTSAVDLIYWRR